MYGICLRRLVYSARSHEIRQPLSIKTRVARHPQRCYTHNPPKSSSQLVFILATVPQVFAPLNKRLLFYTCGRVDSNINP